MDGSGIKKSFHLVLEDKAFLVFCISTAFISLVSIHMINVFPVLGKRSIILIACCMPWALVFFNTFRVWFRDRALRNVTTIIAILVMLGFINMVFSENRPASITGISLFFMSGIMIFAASLFLLNTRLKQNLFLWLCSAILFMLCILGIGEFIRFALSGKTDGYPIFLVFDNALPAGSMLVMLSIGPLILLKRVKEPAIKNLLSASLGLAVGVVFLIGERGPILSIVVMGLTFGLFHRQFLRLFIGVVFIGLLVFSFKDNLPLFHQGKLKYFGSIVYRLESFPLSLRVFQDKPIFGIGYNGPLMKHVSRDYVPIFMRRDIGSNAYVSPYQVFSSSKGVLDNIFLTFWVEMGTIFSLLYFGSISFLLAWAFCVGKGRQEVWGEMVPVFCVLAGVFVNAITFDILKYPSHNWVFHSILGILFIKTMEELKGVQVAFSESAN